MSTHDSIETNGGSMNIQWYPGHMTKARRMIEENMKLIDVVIEVLDARIPQSSRNPDIDQLARNKKRIVILNKSDLADSSSNKEWERYFNERGIRSILANSVSGQGIQEVSPVARELMQEKIERLKQKGRIFVPVRAMILGIPNVGKSTLINKFIGKSAAKTGDKPGVTKGKQWLKPQDKNKDFELMDTPGILWPKFEDKNVGIKLAITGAISEDVWDPSELALCLIDLLRKLKPEALIERYRLNQDSLTEKATLQLLEEIAINRAYKKRGDIADLERASVMLLDEYQGAKLGPISLERPS